MSTVSGCSNYSHKKTDEIEEDTSFKVESSEEPSTNAIVNDIKNKKIIFDMGDGQIEEIKSPMIDGWIIVKEDEVDLDHDKVAKWVKGFGEKYDTEGVSRVFTTHDGMTITIEGGDYGWKMDCDKIEEEIEEFLCQENGEMTKNMQPIYVHKAFRRTQKDKEKDWDEENYSEIDLSEQMVYVYKDGKLVYQCKCVTGKDDDEERRTKTGCYYVKEKKEDYILTGDDYSIPTKYWIRITWSGTGYHYMNRSDWEEWSPLIYKTKGSHGCINLKYDDAKKLYELITFYDAVFIYE